MTARARWANHLRTALVAAAAVAIVAAAPVEAQRPPGRQGGDRQEMERRIRARFGEIMRERLVLSQDEARALGQVLESFETERQELRRAEVQLRRQVEAFLRDSPDDDARGRELMATMTELRRREAALFAREQERLLEVLTPAQVVRFHALREELSQRIRRLRGGPGGGPPGYDGARPER